MGGKWEEGMKFLINKQLNDKDKKLRTAEEVIYF